MAKAYPEETRREDVASQFRQARLGKAEDGKALHGIHTVRCKDGSDKIVSFQRVDLEKGRMILTYQDITAEKTAQQKILEAKKQWERTFDVVLDPVMLLDEKCRIVRANRAVTEGLGLSFQEVIGLKCYEVVHGHDCPVSDCPHLTAAAQGKAQSTEIFLHRFNRLFDVRVFPFNGESESRALTVLVARDVTARNKAESILVQSERLKAVADLASGVAHHFNNMLQVVMGEAQLGLMNLELGKIAHLKSHFEQIVKSCRRGSETVKRLQSFVSMRSVESAPEKSG